MVVAVIVVLVVVLAGSGVQAVSVPTTPPASVISAVTNPGPSIFTSVGTGGYTNYDKPPYTASIGFPFLDVAGRFVLYQTSYTPAILQGMSWQQIVSDLSDPQNQVTQAIVGNANFLTAATCVATGNQPGSVCSSNTIQGIEKTLQAEKPAGS